MRWVVGVAPSSRCENAVDAALDECRPITRPAPCSGPVVPAEVIVDVLRIEAGYGEDGAEKEGYDHCMFLEVDVGATFQGGISMVAWNLARDKRRRNGDKSAPAVRTDAIPDRRAVRSGRFLVLC